MNDSHKSLWFNSIPDFNSSCGHDDRQLEQMLVYQLCSFVGFFCLFVFCGFSFHEFVFISGMFWGSVQYVKGNLTQKISALNVFLPSLDCLHPNSGFGQLICSILTYSIRI